MLTSSFIKKNIIITRSIWLPTSLYAQEQQYLLMNNDYIDKRKTQYILKITDDPNLVKYQLR